ncbi:MAG: glycosyltransferase family 4 protein [Chloroflexota bacterium]
MSRICLITTEYPPDVGGMGHAVRRIAHALAAYTPHEVHVLWIENTWSLKGEPLVSDDRLESATSVDVHHSSLEDQEYSDPYIGIYERLRKLQKRVQFDAFVAFGASYSGFPVVLLGKELSVPAIISLHGADLNRDAFKGDRFPHILWSLANARKWVSVTPGELEMARSVSKGGHRGVLIPNHIDSDDFEDGVTTTLCLDKTSIVVAVAASFSPLKGLHILLEAATGITDILVTILVIGGPRQGEESYFAEQLSRYRDRVSIVEAGIVPHEFILSYLKLADIVAVPSLSEGAPNIVLEAMLSGVALVASDVGSVSETIQDGVSGILVAPGSTEALAAALTRLASDEKLRRTMAARAREVVLSRFSTTAEAAAWDRMFGGLDCTVEAS